MTGVARLVNADADDNPPLTSGELSKLRPVAPVKRLRWRLALSQAEFAKAYAIPLGTLRDWEQRRAEPDAPARAYLKAIGADPERVRKAVAA